jgi:hypothetical protein
VLEIRSEHAGHAREVGILENFDCELLAFVVEECATGRRGADVGHQVHEGTLRR